MTPLGALVVGAATGAAVGAVVLGVRLLLFDAPLRDAATLAAGAAVGAGAVSALLALA
jgi:hypothetical protein